MAKFVAFLGEKGGSGKSSLSHFLAHGLGSLPKSIDAVVVTTDPGDDIHEVQRRYYSADGRDHAKLPALLKKLHQTERLVVIVDGAARQEKVDLALQKVGNLLLVPFTPAHSDVVRAARHLEKLPSAIGVPNRWPTHPAARQHANKLLDLLPRDRVIGPVPMIGKLADLTHPGEYQRAATALSRASQSFAIEILHRMKIHPFDLRKLT